MSNDENYMCLNLQTGRQTGRYTDKQRQADRQTDREWATCKTVQIQFKMIA